MTTRGWHNVILVGLAACSVAGPARAEDATTGAPVRDEDVAREDGIPPVRILFDPPLPTARRSGPDWIRRISRVPGERPGAVDDDWHVALQRERGDGADLFTIRYPLAALGPLHTYVGAGLNRAAYFAHSSSEPTIMSRGNRQSSVGAAAELGAVFRLSEKLLMKADLRWIDLADGAGILSDGDALIGAGPVAFGLSVGWRFP
jgi:hypothetical protein